MKALFLHLFHKVASALRERLHLALEILAWRHQLAVLERSGKRPQFSPADRCVWILLSTVWARWQKALKIVQADTVRRWRRQGWRHCLGRRHGRQRPGRPAIAAEVRALIRQMSRENVLWGAPRIHGELAKLGVRVSRTTVAKYMDRRPGPPSLTWRTFIRHHVPDVISSRTYAQPMQNLRAFSVQILQILRRGLDRLVASGWRVASCRDHDTAEHERLWTHGLASGHG
jgi:putative transposase